MKKKTIIPLSKWWTSGLSKDRHDLFWWLQGKRTSWKSPGRHHLWVTEGILFQSWTFIYFFPHCCFFSTAFLLLDKKVKLLLFLSVLVNQYAYSQYMKKGFCLQDLFWKLEYKSLVVRRNKPWLSSNGLVFLFNIKKQRKGAALKSPHSFFERKLLVLPELGFI